MKFQKMVSSILRMKNKELNIMTTQTSNTRRFSPIFTATVTPGSVSTRSGKNGKYAVMQNSLIQRDGKDDKTMTVMAFGKPREEVARSLRKGRPVDLAVQYDGGTLRVIGFPRAEEPAAANA